MPCSQCCSTGTWTPSTTTFQGGQKVVTHYHSQARSCPLCDGTGEQRRAYAFSSGSQFMDWHEENCVGCAKGYDENRRVWRCELEAAIDEASIGDGTVPIEAYRRLALDTGRRCTEYEESK